MGLLNRGRYVLRLPCDRLTALGLLRAHTWDRTLNSQGMEKYFSGTLGKDEFRLMPLISGRNLVRGPRCNGGDPGAVGKAA